MRRAPHRVRSQRPRPKRPRRDSACCGRQVRMAAEKGQQLITRELLFAAFAGPSTEADDPRLLERVAASVEEETVPAGHVLFREGDGSEWVHFMSEGRMRLTRPGAPDWVYIGRWVVGTTDVLVGRRHQRTA